MPSLDHESLIVLFRNQPELAAQLLRDALHLELPAYTEARLASSDLTEVVPTEFRADAVVLLVEGKPVLGVVVEAQLSRDERKRFSWPAYISVLRARHECPVELLVLSPDRAVAAWAAAPIQLDLAGHLVLRPRVLGPDGVPLVTDPEQAKRAPEFAVLSALAHSGDEPELAGKVGAAAIIAALGLDPERGGRERPAVCPFFGGGGLRGAPFARALRGLRLASAMDHGCQEARQRDLGLRRAAADPELRRHVEGDHVERLGIEIVELGVDEQDERP